MSPFAIPNFLMSARRALLIAVTATPMRPVALGPVIASSGVPAVRRDDRPVITYYGISLRVDPATRSIAGAVRAVGHAAGAAAMIDLDLAGTLHVDSVVVVERRGSTRAAVERNDGHL